MKIFKMSDRIKVKIDDITLHIAPLSLEHKEDISSDLLQFGLNNEIKYFISSQVKAVKYFPSNPRRLEKDCAPCFRSKSGPGKRGN